MAKLGNIGKLKIETIIEDKKYQQELRPYLGMSTIGKKCPRELWYDFRWATATEHSARLKRLFSRGHREEPIIVQDLIDAGCIVTKTGDDQQEFVDGNGHIKGHGDGEVMLLPDASKTVHLLECKTANDKKFNEMKKQGLQKANPVYYAQCIVYMYKGEYKRCLFVMVNKNTDERYYERVYADNVFAKELLIRGFGIISSEIPPAKIGKSTSFDCKFCNHYDVCHLGEAPFKTCRTCNFCDIHDDGIWKCSLKKIKLTTSQQKIGCDAYKLLKTLA